MFEAGPLLFFEKVFLGSPTWTVVVQKGVKALAVIGLKKVAELVDDDVAQAFGRIMHELGVEGDGCRLDVAAAPS